MWTYTGNPRTSAVDEVHYRLGDVNPDQPLASDEECAQALLDEGGNPYLAAAALAETKALALLMRPSRVTRDGRTVEYSQQVEAFRTLAETLRRHASIRTTGVYAGGISQAEKDAARLPSDDVRPFATTRLHEFPGSPGSGRDEDL